MGTIVMCGGSEHSTINQRPVYVTYDEKTQLYVFFYIRTYGNVCQFSGYDGQYCFVSCPCGNTFPLIQVLWDIEFPNCLIGRGGHIVWLPLFSRFDSGSFPLRVKGKVVPVL
jgi:hypothetical protein